jgi:hypothetical protein
MKERFGSATSPPEAAQIRRIVDARLRKDGRMLHGVKAVEVDFGEDSTGDPAVWISLTVDDEISPSQQRISELSDLARSLRDEILKTGIAYWPYVNFRVSD